MNYTNSTTGALGRTTVADWWPLADVAQAWRVSLQNLHRLVAEKLVETTTINGEERVPYHRVQRGVGTNAIMALQRWKRDATPQVVQGLDRALWSTAGELAGRFGHPRNARATISPQIVQELIDSGAVQSEFDPVSGQRLTRAKFLKQYLDPLGGARHLDRLQLQYDDRERERAYLQKIENDKKNDTDEMLEEARQKESARVQAGVDAAMQKQDRERAAKNPRRPN